MESFELKCTSGSIVAKVGDRFTDHSGEWEIVSLKDETVYSPSYLGGAPIVVIKPIGRMPSHFQSYANEDGTIDFCGDSVAAMLESAGCSRRSSKGR